MPESALDLLHRIFGHREFRGEQAQIVEQVARGGDALVLMPTGGGKSLCYQLPALLRAGTAIVVSPLIALMQDQVEALRQLGVRAAFLNSSLDAANARIDAGEPNAFEVIDLFRGRQVWIDHGGGIVTRYAHLDGIPPDIVVGRRVAQGEVVGFVGDSGTPESISSPDTEIHLHWELRVGDDFLGDGLPPEDVRAIYEGLFEPIPVNASFQ